jgi:ornithine decarboxylase
MDMKTAEELAGRYGTPALFLSKGRIRENIRAIRGALPGVTLFYALKANAHPAIIETIRAENGCFDVCTNGEIDLVEAAGVSGDQCLHTHPVKRDEEICRALDFGINLFVADNPHELRKLARYKDRLGVLIRIAIQNPGVMVNLSYKFGVAPERAFGLIEQAWELGLEVKGISFHAGSQNENNLKYIEGLDYCRDICRMAALAGRPLKIIDIGGGFPITYCQNVEPLVRFCQPISEYLDRFFSGYRVIAEPGRVISGPAVTLIAKVIGKSMRGDTWWYYLDDGVYNSFSGAIYDHVVYPFFVSRDGPRFASVLAGPTCDSFDVLYENITLPELDIGDLIVFDAMGAYTSASASTFNGYSKTRIVALD